MILACGLYRILEPKHLPRYTCARVHVRTHTRVRARYTDRLNISLKIILIVNEFINHLRLFPDVIVVATSDLTFCSVIALLKKKMQKLTFLS